MSATASAITSPSEPKPRQTGVLPSRDDEAITLPRSLQRSIARRYTSLQEHADSVLEAAESPGIGSTPRAKHRRESFTWEDHQPEGRYADQDLARLPTPLSPPPLEEILRKNTEDADAGPESYSNGFPKAPSRAPTQDMSVNHSTMESIERVDTSRSSFTGLARGVMKHVPDMRMFEKTPDLNDSDAHGLHRRSIAVLLPKFDPSEHSSDTEPKDLMTEYAEEPAPSFTTPEPSNLEHAEESALASTFSTGPRLKDRRNLAPPEAMKLTLPLNLPDLPSRKRTPASERKDFAQLVTRSPRVPERSDRHTSAPTTMLPPLTQESHPDHRSIGSKHDSEDSTEANKSCRRPRVRFGGGGSEPRTNDSLRRGPDLMYAQQEQPANTVQQEQARSQIELSPKVKRTRSRRWRWSDTSQLLKAKFASQSNLTSKDVSTAGRSLWRCKSIASRPKPDAEATIATMAVPPKFTPPGQNRVPTPPMFDEQDEVKGKLANFFFDIHGDRTRKPPASPGSIWDSDLLLMPQHTDISPPDSNESDGSPQAPASPQAPSAISPLAAHPASAYLAHPPPATPGSAPRGFFDAEAEPNWFRVELGGSPKGPVLKAGEERAKLEWLIPEHLPNSPLCPLNPKYRGPSKGVCVFHGRRKSVVGSRAGGERRISEVIEKGK